MCIIHVFDIQAVKLAKLDIIRYCHEKRCTAIKALCDTVVTVAELHAGNSFAVAI